jgi:uncharacterized protein
VQKIIADSGPLIALFDHDDPRHRVALDFFRSWKGGVLITWPVATEVCHLLGFSVDVQLDFLRWAKSGGVTVEDLPEDAFEQIVAWTEKYRDLPMDLADASILILAMRTGIRSVVSFDSDFEVYRLPDKKRLRNLITHS